jgi:hypothetical protein
MINIAMRVQMRVLMPQIPTILSYTCNLGWAYRFHTHLETRRSKIFRSNIVLHQNTFSRVSELSENTSDADATFQYNEVTTTFGTLPQASQQNI